MKLSLLKALYTDTLTKVYSLSEAQNIFYIVLQWLEKKSKTDVIVGNETLLSETYMDILAELQKGVPVQYLTNEAPFYNLDYYVDERVLIPRPETEQLVHLILQEHPKYTGSVLDIGTGSGCIAITLAKNWPNAQVSACDVSSDALAVAQKNADTHQAEVSFLEADILKDEIGDNDIIVSNPPYIAENEKVEMHKNVLEHEPHLALFVENTDPLLFYKRITQLAAQSKAICYFETSEFYREQLDQWLEDEKYTFVWKQDFQGKNRILQVSFT